MNTDQEQLHRGLQERHISLMAIGAAIGVGLFLGSASTIELAGPAILGDYLLGGALVFLIMRALGEMAVHQPVAGSFSRYAQEYVGPLAGYLTGWTYWFLWIVAGMAEITAVGVYMHVWYPHVPNWIWALAAVLLMGTVNFIEVRAYGEFEFWFALIKVVTIVLMIVCGAAIIVFGLGNDGVATGIHNLWTHGGLAPHGIAGMALALPLVVFAYGGVELVGVTAGEAKNPSKTLTRAVNFVFWRVLIFYVGSLFVIMSIYPWNEIGMQGSPFVVTFQKMGIPAAADIVNLVVITAALSSCSSGIFGTARMLFNLARQKQALPVFARVNAHGVPVHAVLVSVAMLIIGVVLNYLVPKQVFEWLSGIVTFAILWTWAMILLSHYRFRQRVPEQQRAALPVRLPFATLSTCCAAILLAIVTIIMAMLPGCRIALAVGPAWLIMLVSLYYATGRRRTPDAIAEKSSL